MSPQEFSKEMAELMEPLVGAENLHTDFVTLWAQEIHSGEPVPLRDVLQGVAHQCMPDSAPHQELHPHAFAYAGALLAALTALDAQQTAQQAA